MADNTVVVAIIGVVGGGGLFGGIVALLKVRPESGAILVKSATDVVVIQREAVTDMQQRLSNVEAENARMRQERDEAVRERDDLRQRVAELEANVRDLQRRTDQTETSRGGTADE